MSFLSLIPYTIRALVLAGVALLLSGCLLASGEQISTDIQPQGGNRSAVFVSAEGSTERTLDTGEPGLLNVIVIVAVDQGDLRLDLLEPDGSLAFSVEGSPQEQRSRSGNIQTDDEGRLRYRVVAQSARNGNYQILYQR